MITSEQDAVVFSKQIEDAYQSGLGRKIDYSGFASYLLWHMHINGKSIDWVKEILTWGELPPDKIIADGWDSLNGVWPMIGVMHDSLRQAFIADAKAKHRNTMLILLEHPGGDNGPKYLKGGMLNSVISVPLESTDVKYQRWDRARKDIEAAGLKHMTLLTSWDAVQVYGDPVSRMQDWGARAPPSPCWLSIEADELWNSEDRARHGSALAAQGHTVWMHYRPYVMSPHGSWCHGLMYQVEEDLGTAAQFQRVKDAWNGRPVVLAEMKQSVSPQDRWNAFQQSLKIGSFGGCHVGYI